MNVMTLLKMMTRKQIRFIRFLELSFCHGMMDFCRQLSITKITEIAYSVEIEKPSTMSLSLSTIKVDKKSRHS